MAKVTPSTLSNDANDKPSVTIDAIACSSVRAVDGGGGAAVAVAAAPAVVMMMMMMSLAAAVLATALSFVFGAARWTNSQNRVRDNGCCHRRRGWSVQSCSCYWLFLAFAKTLHDDDDDDNRSFVLTKQYSIVVMLQQQDDQDSVQCVR